MFALIRHQNAPILAPEDSFAWEKEGVFNPGVIQTPEGIVMLYRAVGETDSYISRLGLARSEDGITFERASDAPVFGPKEPFDLWGTEDPRITKIGGDYFITYVALATPVMQQGKFSANIVASTALLRTKDFAHFENLGLISPKDSDNKDIVLFPKKINGRYCMLHRPNFWDKPWHEIIKQRGKVTSWPYDVETLPEHPGIWIAWSDNLKDWTDHKLFLHASHHEDSKIGPGLPPIETKEGWLVIYHHVAMTSSQDALVYSVRAALFSLKEPTRLIGKLPYDILRPEMPYETERSSQIVFPTGGFIKGDELYVYYGASDRYICLATGSLSELLSELKKNGQNASMSGLKSSDPIAS